MANKLVYSTGGEIEKPTKEKSWTTASGPMKMRLESKGRGGKQVTVLFNLPFSRAEAEKHLKALQGQLGTGGTLTESTIEFRGDQRDRVEPYFAKLAIKVVRAGG